MTRTRSTLRFIGSFLLALFLVGCNSATFNQTEGNVATTKEKLADTRVRDANMVKPTPPLLIKDGLYVDTTPVSLERQPEWLKNPIVIRGDSMPFSYYTRVIANGADKNVLSKFQAGIDTTIVLSMNYSGTVKGALDLIASKTGYVFNIQHGNTIYWQAFITRTFSVAFMPGTSDYFMGQKAGAGASSSGSSGNSVGGTNNSISEFSSLQATSLSVWKDVEETVKQLLSTDGKVVVSQSATSVTVRDKPTHVELVAQYIRNLNKSLSQQVFVKIEVLDVSLENDYNWGINWEVLETAFAHSNFLLNANYGTPLTITPLTGGAIPTGGLGPSAATQALVAAGATTVLSAVVSALSQQGKVSVVAQPRVVCMNNQVSVISITDTIGYIQSVQNTSVPASSSSGSGSQTVNNVSTITSQITPGSVQTGFTLYVLPKILNEKVFLQVNVDLSQNQGIQTLCAQSGTQGAGSCASSSYQIQVPHVTEKTFNQRAVLTSGETLVMSGLRQIQNKTGAMQLFNVQELGGKASTQTNSDTVVLITPYILYAHGTA